MNILLTSVGRRTYLIEYFKDALSGKGEVHASNSIITYSLLQADKYVLTPNIYDDGYISFLLDYCMKNDIYAIIPLFDIDLPVLAKNKTLFSLNNIQLIVSDYRATEICNDKWLTYNFLVEIGLPQSPTFISLEDTQEAILSKKIEYPIIVKPRLGMGSIGLYRADNEEELRVFYNKLQKEIFNTYLKYESSTDIGSCIIIQEMINGQEYGLDILNDLDGNYVTCISKKKIAMRAGETDIAEIVSGSDFETTAKAISERLKHIANLDVDCFIAENNCLVVLEMNCRFGGQYPFSHLAGVDFPRQIVEWLENKPTDMSLLTPQIGIVGCKELKPCIIKYGR